MTRLLIVMAAAILFYSCGQEKPKINHEAVDTTSVVDDRIKDTTKILVSELPVKFDSTDVILFAIGLVDLQERGGYSKISSGSYGGPDIASSYFIRANLVGTFIKIRKVDFLREIFKKTKAGYLLYSISDRDSNGDKELDHADLEALYISKIDGTDFKKISKELHEFYDYNLIRGENRVYFRTLEDINKDGELNNKDKFHYYYIDFSVDNYTVIEYDPVKIFE